MEKELDKNRRSPARWQDFLAYMQSKPELYISYLCCVNSEVTHPFFILAV